MLRSPPAAQHAPARQPASPVACAPLTAAPGLSPSLCSPPAARGPFERDARHGPGGECEYADGGRYVGGWRADARSGRGRMEVPDGTVYEGEWEDDARHGEGEAAAGACLIGIGL
jgi:hypothetical protein